MEEENVFGDEEKFLKDEKEIFRERKKKIVSFLKKNYNWVSYVFLAVIVFLAVKIRTRNLSGLRDITTGTWTLGPDLDPFFFLRMCEYIIEHGKIMAVDTMRYVPLGFETREEYLLHPYLMAWFHKVAVLFGSESVTHSAVLYPVFMFALTVIAFFFLTRKIFVERMGEKKANIIALISSFFLTVIPSLLPRTIAGIPEKESVGFLFLFLAFYFFLASWKSEGMKSRVIFALLAGIASAGMANIWGGYAFIFLSIGPAVFLAFFLEKIERKEIYTYGIWIFVSFVLMNHFAPRMFSMKSLFTSINTAPVAVVLFMIVVHFVLFNSKLKNYFRSDWLSKVPPRVISAVISILLLIVLIFVFLGPSFISYQINALVTNLVRPAASRLIQTVAENRQPYFTEWANNFGPSVNNIPIIFWLFFIGSIYLFRDMIYKFKKGDRRILTIAYVVFLISIVFSRYSSGSIFNGENFVSLSVYAIGFLVLLGSAGFYYYKYCRVGEEEKFKQIDFGFIFLFMFFFISILSARGAVRTIMVLVPSASMIVSYFVVAIFSDVKKVKDETWKVIAWILVGIILLGSVFAGYGYYKISNAQAESYVPTVYTHQWQKAMQWVRENTPEDAVFGHWWDYGYWLQSIGERATVLDGGNAVSYWNHMMGRYALTGSDETQALEFLYVHNTTYFLIDSTDIGKYGAFSSIGSDMNYDRASYIPTFLKVQQGTQELKNSTIFVYQGAFGVEDDIIYEENGTRIFLPKGAAGIGGVMIERENDGKIIEQPRGVFVYQNQQYALPLRYVFDGELIDFGSGVEAGVFLYPVVSSDGTKIDIDGALLYLGERTINSQLVKHYLFGEEDAFELVHSQDDFVIEQIKSQNPDFKSDFIQYQGFRGPIKIWKINYPAGIEFKEEYISTDYPSEIRLAT